MSSLEFLDRKNAAMYIKTLIHFLLSSVREKCYELWGLQQDKASKYRAGKINQWIRENADLLDWSAKISDLNSIINS